MSWDSQRYSAKHWRVAYYRGRPRRCEFCDSTNASRYEWATRHGTDGMLPSDYIRLCHPCHMQYDNSGRTKLTTTQIAEVRERFAKGATKRKLGQEYGVQRSTIAVYTQGLSRGPDRTA